MPLAFYSASHHVVSLLDKLLAHLALQHTGGGAPPHSSPDMSPIAQSLQTVDDVSELLRSESDSDFGAAAQSRR